MNFKTTLVLLVLLAGVGVFLAIKQFQQPATTETTENAGKLFSVAPEDVSSIAIKSTDGRQTSFERIKGEWKITAPVNAPAESWQVDQLVRDVVDVQSRNRIDLDADKTGLNEPRYIVELSTSAGQRHTLKIGSSSAVGEFVYAQLDDRKSAEVIPSSLLEQFSKPANSYRQTRLLDVATDRVASVSVSGSSSLTAQKTGDAWRITAPAAMPADASEMSSWLSEITNLSAAEFVAETSTQPAMYGLQNPTAVVTLQTTPPATQPAATGPTTAPVTTAPTATAPAPVVIKLGRYEDVLKKHLFAQVDNGPVVKVLASALTTVNKTPLDLRERAVISLEPTDVRRISISRENQATTQPTTRPASKHSVTLARRPQVVTPAGPPAPATKPLATQPATGPATATASATSTAPTTATAPATASAPASEWIIESPSKGDGDDTKVSSLLESLHPLRATKYLPKPPDAKPVATYTLRIEAGNNNAATEVQITDSADGQALTGKTGDLTFELDRSMLEKLDALLPTAQ